MKNESEDDTFVDVGDYINKIIEENIDIEKINERLKMAKEYKLDGIVTKVRLFGENLDIEPIPEPIYEDDKHIYYEDHIQNKAALEEFQTHMESEMMQTLKLNSNMTKEECIQKMSEYLKNLMEQPIQVSNDVMDGIENSTLDEDTPIGGTELPHVTMTVRNADGTIKEQRRVAINIMVNPKPKAKENNDG